MTGKMFSCSLPLQYFYQTLPCPCVNDVLNAFEDLTYKTLVVDNFSWQKLLVLY